MTADSCAMNPFNKTESVTKPADYIGSFLVTGKGHHERAEIVRQKLEAARLYTHSKPILLLISLSGIKVCHENNKHIYMAHALRRISYATCDPDHLQFAFLAREPKAQPNVQYCHAFVTTTPEAAEELNTIMGEAFRLAYMRQRFAVLTNINPILNQPDVLSKNIDEIGQSALVSHSESSVQTPVAVEPNPQISGSENGKTPSASCNDQNFRDKTTPINSVLNKPLPPLPHDELGTETTVPTCSATVTDVDQSDQAIENKRGQKSHKHRHKHHHHHHHRHKQRDAATTTNDNDLAHIQTNVETGNNVSSNIPNRANSDQHYGADSSLVCCSSSVAPVPKRSFVMSSNTDPNQLTNGKLLSHTESTSTNYRLSQHFYDTAAAQQCCEVLSPDNSNCASIIDVTTNPSTSTTTTTTSSSTTGCSTSGSGCFGSSSDGSLQGSKQTGLISAPADDSERRCVLSVRHCDNQQQHTGPHSNQNSSTVQFNSQLSNVTDETNELAHAAWYQPNISRDKALEILAKQPRGSFVIRDSGSHANCFALSVRSGEIHDNCDLPAAGAVHGQKPSSGASGRLLTGGGVCTYPFAGATTAASANTGVSHFLIQRTSRCGYKLKGLEKEWPSLSCLVLHLTVMPEMLPCLLRLPKASANPLFNMSDQNPVSKPPSNFEQSPGLNAAHFRSISDVANRVADSASLDEALARLSDEDEDYQRLSDFSSIMADLKLRPRSHVQKNSLVTTSRLGVGGGAGGR